MKKCAIYTRVSTSMQAEKEFNSCESQRDRILSFVKSQEDLEIYKEYADPGFSGASLDRPGLSELLRDVEDRKVRVVLAYKIDRLTRSSKDFYMLIDFFEKHGVSFVSVTEHFDTSSPSGRLLRNIMLTFAQFERELAAERTRDKMAQRAEKGMWNGGYVPLGYRAMNKKLAVDRKRAEMIRRIFERFVLTGSLKRTTEFVLQNGFRHPLSGNFLSMTSIAYILRNPVYTGKIKWGKTLYDGRHERIISNELFQHAQALTREKIRERRLHKQLLLTGLLRCSECGSTMTPTFTSKKERRYYYYKCYKVIREGRSACGIKAVNAEALEGFLTENLLRISADRQYIENLALKTAYDSGRRSGFELLESSSKVLEEEITEVLERFRGQFESGTQIEKALIMRRTIQKIILSRESVEVILKLRDTQNPLIGNTAF